MANENQNNTVTVQAKNAPVTLPNRFKGETYVSRGATESKVLEDIKSMAASNSDNQDELHKLAMDCLELAFNPKNNNYDVATQFLRMIEQSYSYSAGRLQVKKWFQSFGPYRLIKKDGIDSFRKSNSDKAVEFNIQGAYENPWYTMGVRETQTAEAIIEALSSDSAIDSVTRLVSKLNGWLKDVQEGKAELKRPDIDGPVLQHIRDSLVKIETGAKKERDTLKTQMLDAKEQNKTQAA